MKIGILIDSTKSQWYLNDLLEWIQSHPNLNISALLIQNNSRKKIPLFKDSFRNILNRAIFKFINVIEKKLIFLKYPKYKKHFDKFDLKKFNLNEIILIKDDKSSKNGTYFQAKSINDVKKLNLDLIIRGGNDILKGEILHSSKYGIISFHHGDNTFNRGGPAGFWEVYERNPKTGFTIQILDENLDGGKVLKRGNFLTEQFYTLNEIILKERSNFYLKKILLEINFLNQLPPFEANYPYYKKIYKSPNFVNSLKYLFSRCYDKLINFILKVFTNDVWHVGYQKEKVKKFNFYKSNIIKNSENSFLADPFVIEHERKNYLFAEEYNFNTKKGVISVFEINEKKYTRLGIALEETFHLSFPYIFKYDDKFYMTPETKKTKEIRIYECNEFPKRWSFKKTILKNIEASDTLIFEYDNLWWLLTTFSNTNHNTDSELQIYYSEDGPLTDDWISFKNNPVIIDPDLGRNGGIFFDDKKIYRVSQSYGFNNYGKKLNLNEIVILKKNKYLEKKYFSIEADFFNNLKGIHHINSNENYTVFDYCKREFKKFL